MFFPLYTHFLSHLPHSRSSMGPFDAQPLLSAPIIKPVPHFTATLPLRLPFTRAPPPSWFLSLLQLPKSAIFGLTASNRQPTTTGRRKSFGGGFAAQNESWTGSPSFSSTQTIASLVNGTSPELVPRSPRTGSLKNQVRVTHGLSPGVAPHS